MAEDEDHRPLRSKRKAISALLPYAVWQERDGQPEMLNAILRTAKASKILRFMWHHVDEFVSTLVSEASPRAIILTSPHIPWDLSTGRDDLIQQWAAAASVVQYTEEVARGVVDTLLQIVSEGGLVPIHLWSWLAKCPPLPPICRGRFVGSHAWVVNTVRALGDVGVFKSYLLVVWSEWDNLWSDGFDEMGTCILEDFAAVGMGHHRADLIQRLDHVLGQLDPGLESLEQHNLDLYRFNLQTGKDQYQRLKETLLEINAKAISRTSRSAIMSLRVLTPTPDGHRIPHNIYVCTPSPIPIV